MGDALNKGLVAALTLSLSLSLSKEELEHNVT